MASFLLSNLRRQRNKLKQTLKVASDFLEISPQHLSQIESGGCDPRLSTVEKVAAGYGQVVILVPENKVAAVRRFIESGGRTYTLD